MKLYALPEETVNKTLAYLATKPFVEVSALIAAVQQAQLITNNDGTPFEVPSETPALEASAEVLPEASNGSGTEATA